MISSSAGRRLPRKQKAPCGYWRHVDFLPAAAAALLLALGATLPAEARERGDQGIEEEDTRGGTARRGGLAVPDDEASWDEETFETVITSARREEDAFESPRAVDSLSRRELRNRLPATTPEALANQPALLVQRTNLAGGAPILRGLIGQHVLLLLDGVRLNNAITRFGPNQYLNLIDPFQLERIEVLRGPGSVLYGSDAMGGVINLISRKPVLDPRRIWNGSTEAVGRFDSATTGLLGHGAVGAHLRSFGVRAGGTAKRFDDLRGGRDTGVQPFTGYHEGSADLSAAWAAGDTSVLRLAYSTVRQHDAARTDQSSPADFRRFTDQVRDLALLSYSGRFESRALSRLEGTFSFHRQRELRERFRLAQDKIDREHDRVASLGAQIGASSRLPHNTLTYGVDLYHDWVGSSAESELISMPVREPGDRGRYVDSSRYLQLGVYVVDRLTVGRKLAFDAGARVSAWDIDIPADPATNLAALRSTKAGVVGSLHGRYLVGDGLNLVAGVGQGFRAPNIDDYSALGCSGQGYDVPNPDLAPEKSVTAEAGVKLDLFGVVTGSLFYYFSYLDDMIVRVPAAIGPGGTVPQMQCGTTSGGLPNLVAAKRRENARSATIHGIEAAAQIAIGRRWLLFAWAAWTRGQVTLEQAGSPVEPLGRIPPLNGLAGVRFLIEEVSGFAELGVRWARRQERLSSGDLDDLRICPGGSAGCEGTPGYAAFTIRGSARLARPLRLTLSIENFTNETYRVHGSGIDGPGVSGVVGLELSVP